MKYEKPEIKDIELLDPKTFVSCSPTDYEIPENDGNNGMNNSNGSWKEPSGPTE